jgi:Prokaryotic homologs of the JAB domain
VSATTDQPWRLSAQSQLCRFLSSPSSTRVRFAPGVEEKLCSLAARSPATEIGGLLFGATSRYLIDVLELSTPGRHAQRSRDEYVPDTEHDLAVADDLRASSGLEAIGNWHSHTRRLSTAHSSADIDAASRYRHGFDVDRWLSVIVARDDRGWFVARRYVVRPGHGSVDYCEPAR